MFVKLDMPTSRRLMYKGCGRDSSLLLAELTHTSKGYENDCLFFTMGRSVHTSGSGLVVIVLINNNTG